ncbi:hypothetical protein [Lysobacter sp. CA199]|uniref:hypothetical protein n=1 Tax=Lysobacter sp. CA199 TaxID=3455608 RepID=UPI003F8D8C90
MNTASADTMPPAVRRPGKGPIFAATLVAPLLALAAVSAHGKCATYINADGSVQAKHGEADCYAGGSASRIATGVYSVDVSYPLDSQVDEETGVWSYSFTQGICSASISNNDPRVSSIQLSTSDKPHNFLHDVPHDYSSVVSYTVRTFAATTGPTLVPADQDFTMICIDWMPYEPMKRGSGR